VECQMTESVDVGEIAGEVVEFMMSRLPSNLEGISFIETSIEILTLCLSEVIKAGYCSKHYQYAIEKSIEHIRKDFER